MEAAAIAIRELQSRRRDNLLAFLAHREGNQTSLQQRAKDLVRARYGDTEWGKDLLTARRLVEAGVRFVQCQANFRLRKDTGVTSNWDDHSVNCDIFKAYEERFPVLDQSVSALIEDLAQRGLDRHVLFIFCGEFATCCGSRTRTPAAARAATTGRER